MSANLSPYDILDARFNALIFGSARLDHLGTGFRWAEGPVYVPAGRYVLFSDIPNDRVMRFDETDGGISVFASPCGYHNGHTLDAQGRVLNCEHGGRAVSRTEHDGSRHVLASHYQGKRLNSPNDLVLAADGAVWFTDPTYGIDSSYEGHAAPSEIGASQVYRIDPSSGDVAMVVSDLVKPNGLAFSPDGRLLYVADTGATHVPGLARAIYVYPVAADGRSVGRGRLFAECDAGLFDGFRIDWHGNLWASSADAVRCYASDGTLLGKIQIPEIVSNLCFGGPKRNRLYITAQTSLYAIYVNSHPAGWQAPG